MSGLRRDRKIMVVKILLVVKKQNLLIQPINSTPPGSDPLQIEKPNPDLVIKPPAKGILRNQLSIHMRELLRIITLLKT
jgi:hypothetical protein